MQRTADSRYRSQSVREDLRQAGLLEEISAVREYMRTMEARVRELEVEKVRLQAELARLKGKRDSRHWSSEASRITDELDQFMRLYDVAARRRSHSYNAPEYRPEHRSNISESSLLRKMMLVLMLSDLT